MSNIHIFSDNVLAKAVLQLAITAATTAGTVIDTMGYTRAALVCTMTPTGAATTANCSLTEGSAANGSDQASVTGGAFAQSATGALVGIQVLNIDLTFRKRYLSASFTGAGGAAAGIADVKLFLYNGEGLPPAQDNATITV